MSVFTRAEEISDEIAARLALRTIALGAETDLGVKVYQGRKFVDDSMIPCVAVIDGGDAPDKANVLGDYDVTQSYAIVAYLPCDPDHPNRAAHAGIRDIKKALFNGTGRGVVTFGGKVKEVQYLGREIGPRADGAAFVVAMVEVAVRYVENVAAP